jgi:hypothetical protein
MQQRFLFLIGLLIASYGNAQTVSPEKIAISNFSMGSNYRLIESSKTIKSKREWLFRYQKPGDSVHVQSSIETVTDDLVEEYSVQITTTDTKPVTVLALPTKPGYKYRLEVVCNGVIDGGNGSLEGKKKRGFLVDAGWMINAGVLNTIEPTEYLGGGLSSADYIITNNDSEIIVQVTGEANALIRYEFKIKFYALWTNL